MKHKYVIYIEKKTLTDMKKNPNFLHRIKLGICVYCKIETHFIHSYILFVCVCDYLGLDCKKKKIPVSHCKI